MLNNGPVNPRGESPEDSRLRYSRKAVLSGLLGAGTLLGFGKPLEALRQTSEDAGGPGSPTTESSVPSVEQATESKAKDKKPGKKQGSPEQEENSREADRGEAQEKPPVPDDPTMALYIPRLGIQGHTVRNGNSERLLAIGAMKLPNTGFPWQDNANPYITGHRIGYPGQESRYQFYNLPAMRRGDWVALGDVNGTLYEYRVIEKFAVSPWESWVTEPVEGRDLVTLQTCVDSVARSTWWYITPKLMEAGPNTGRLIVRAERV